ncbi:hypothetical protein NQ318_010075 [Aromia moschata]|uniref:Uncharacterized protein n=1 Tax=Aromia moschata TaxID=1265417 RepID=A0AAV8YFS7_9CUCU|nr:hypothetical protein NQ318_010075 [Aromia moschata]
MIHHRDLLRTNSDGQERGFSAPIGNYLNEVDCGITALPCLTKCLHLERCAKFGVFVAVLSMVGFFHGAIINYFRGTSNLWSTHYNISQDTIGLFLPTRYLLVYFALCVAYWGNRIHRASWIGALTMFVAVSGALLAVPEVYNPFSGSEIDDSISGSLCNSNISRIPKYTEFTRKEFDIIAFTSLIAFQLHFAIATVSFVCHGMTYIDDHISPKHSPGFIVWITLCVLVFIMGSMIAMFPKVLPNVVMLKSVNSLLSLASGNNTHGRRRNSRSLWRVLRNKVLMINILSLVLIESALINFNILQKDYNQSNITFTSLTIILDTAILF